MNCVAEKNEAPTAATVEASQANSVAQESGANGITRDAFDATAIVQPFEWNSKAVRVLMKAGEPWFVASDVCTALEYKNASDAVATHLDEDERMTIAHGDSHSGKRGGARLMTLINESGLYALVLRSRKPEARKFAKWVTGEVLPSIRKTGAYQREQERTPYSVAPRQALSAENADLLRNTMNEFCDRLPQEKKSKFMSSGYSKLSGHFKCSYREIPNDQFSDAMAIVARHIVSYASDVPAINPFGPHTRWLADVDQHGRFVLTPMPSDKILISQDDLPNLCESGAIRGLPLMRLAQAATMALFKATADMPQGWGKDVAAQIDEKLPLADLNHIVTAATMELNMRTRRMERIRA